MGMARRAAAEFIGSAALAAIVVGSGIAATRLSDDVGMQLLINALATALGLYVLITVFGALSGAQFNPAVTLVDAALGSRRVRDLAPYLCAQVLGCVAGTVLANLMFGLAAVSVSATQRASAAHLLAEVVATAGLVVAIFVLVRSDRAVWVAGVVAAYIGGAYFFTSSTSFANPAITVGRIFSDTFAGIAPSSAPWFIAAQLVGAVIGYAVVRLLVPSAARSAAQHAAPNAVPHAAPKMAPKP